VPTANDADPGYFTQKRRNTAAQKRNKILWRGDRPEEANKRAYFADNPRFVFGKGMRL